MGTSKESAIGIKKKSKVKSKNAGKSLSLRKLSALAALREIHL